MNKDIAESQGRTVGKELYPELTDDDKALIAFGMTPITIIDIASNRYRETVAQHVNDAIFDGLADTPNLATALKPEFVEAFQRGLVLGLMDGAENHGAMIA